jgi:hypothetical protein
MDVSLIREHKGFLVSFLGDLRSNKEEEIKHHKSDVCLPAAFFERFFVVLSSPLCSQGDGRPALHTVGGLN